MISVIVPTYKPQAYLWDCLKSLEYQTLDKSQYEVLLVLNGDKEPYYSDINNFLQAHHESPCTFLYCMEKGVSAARNLGLDNAKGDYITFIDDDDFVSPTYLEEMLAVSSPSCIALAYWYSFNDCEGAFEHIPEQQPFSLTREFERYSPDGVQNAFRPYRFFSGPVIKLFHKDIIGDRRFDVHFSNLEDVLFNFTISDRFHDVAFTSDKAIYYRRMRSNSAAHKRSFARRTRDSFKGCIAYSKVYFKHPTRYKLSFYVTRVLAAIKGALLTDR